MHDIHGLARPTLRAATRSAASDAAPEIPCPADKLGRRRRQSDSVTAGVLVSRVPAAEAPSPRHVKPRSSPTLPRLTLEGRVHGHPSNTPSNTRLTAKQMSEWLTYAQAASRFGVSSEAVRQIAMWRKWPRRRPNDDPFGPVQVLIPSDAMIKSRTPVQHQFEHPLYLLNRPEALIRRRELRGLPDRHRNHVVRLCR